MIPVRPFLALLAASALPAQPVLAQAMAQDREVQADRAAEQAPEQPAEQVEQAEQAGDENGAVAAEAAEAEHPAGQLADASAAGQPEDDAKTCRRNAALKGVLGVLLGEQQLGDALKAQVEAC